MFLPVIRKQTRCTSDCLNDCCSHNAFHESLIANCGLGYTYETDKCRSYESKIACESNKPTEVSLNVCQKRLAALIVNFSLITRLFCYFSFFFRR